MNDNPLAALAMRERAALELTEILDGWEVIRKYHQPGSCAGDSAVSSIRALPTTFTDAELLAAAMQVPEVRALVGSLNTMLFNTVHGNGLEAHYKARDDARAALAPFTKGGE